jgi:TIR domain
VAEGTSESAAKAQPGEPTARGPGDSADVFISYAHEDAGFVRALHDRLVAQGRGVWIDWQSIPYSAEWWAEIERGIEASAAFVVILSPDSVASQICARELAHAEAGHARIIPVVCRDVEQEPVPKSLADRNWIFFRETDDPDAAFSALIATIDTDLEEERLHARLRVRAREWAAGGRKRGALLRGDDLVAAEQWMATSTSRVGTGEKQYVLASRRAVGQFQRRMTSAVTLALVVAIGLSIVALVLRHRAVRQEHAAQSRALAASSLLALDDDPELSLLLAREGVLTQDTSQARQALREALARSHVRRTMRSPTGRIAWAWFTPDRARIVAVDGSGPAHVFDAPTGRLVRTLSRRRYRRPLWEARPSADGSRALIRPNIGPPVVLDVSGRTPPVSLRDPTDTWSSDAVLSPNGRLAVTATLHTGVARAFDARTGALLRTFPGNVGRVAISSDGRQVALSGRGSVTTYDLARPRPLATLRTPPQVIAYARFSPDGSLFTLTDREARRWDPLTGQPGAALQDRGGAGDQPFPSGTIFFTQTDGGCPPRAVPASASGTRGRALAAARSLRPAAAPSESRP